MNTMQVIFLVAALAGTAAAVMFLHAQAVEQHNHRLLTPLAAVAAGMAVWLVYFGLAGLQGSPASPSSSWALLAAGVAIYGALVAHATVRTSPAMGAAAALAFVVVGIAAGLVAIVLIAVMLLRWVFGMAPAIAEESNRSMQEYQARQVRDAAVGRALGQ